eukprot:TRINITY_DN29104_c0_g1_i1.p1 TRINITY_DN29104_c0_g1~~TRINITY_DN29104_c0_g1_i1.p1  ORF type:complete len:386 (-),score=121.95 TRINITY_DN29104_c0_g1_i1:195-1352(-)
MRQSGWLASLYALVHVSLVASEEQDGRTAWSPKATCAHSLLQQQLRLSSSSSFLQPFATAEAVGLGTPGITALAQGVATPALSPVAGVAWPAGAASAAGFGTMATGLEAVLQPAAIQSPVLQLEQLGQPAPVVAGVNFNGMAAGAANRVEALESTMAALAQQLQQERQFDQQLLAAERAKESQLLASLQEKESALQRKSESEAASEEVLQEARQAAKSWEQNATAANKELARLVPLMDESMKLLGQVPGGAVGVSAAAVQLPALLQQHEQQARAAAPPPPLASLPPLTALREESEDFRKVLREEQQVRELERLQAQAAVRELESLKLAPAAAPAPAMALASSASALRAQSVQDGRRQAQNDLEWALAEADAAVLAGARRLGGTQP